MSASAREIARIAALEARVTELTARLEQLEAQLRTALERPKKAA